MRIVIGGDLAPTESNRIFFENGEVHKIIENKVLNFWYDSDLRFFNLECPLYDGNDAILKCGPSLKTTEKSINGIKALKPSLIGIANNHIMDYGANGIVRTCNLINDIGARYIGCGSDENNTNDSLIVESDDGIKVGIYACAEHEFSIAGHNRKGASAYDALTSFDLVYNLKKTCDYVIVIYHGGKEFYRLPSPQIQKVFRRFSDSGADAVILQHNHCVGCYEVWNGSTLVYGQGNFIFDAESDEFWNSGLLLRFDFQKKGKYSFDYLPFIKVNGRLVEDTLNEVKDGFESRSLRLNDADFIMEQYKKFSIMNLNQYLKVFHGYNVLQRIGFKLGLNIPFPYNYSKKNLVAIRNYLECESINEMLVTALKTLTDTN